VELGEDPDREGLARTPLRVDKALRFLTSGYKANIDEGEMWPTSYALTELNADVEARIAELVKRAVS